MSTADISMSYGSMEALAKEINNVNGEFNTMRSGLASLVSSLNGEWEGAAKKEFEVAYSKLAPKLEAIGNVLTRYTAAVNTVAENTKSTDSGTAQLVNDTDFSPMILLNCEISDSGNNKGTRSAIELLPGCGKPVVRQ